MENKNQRFKTACSVLTQDLLPALISVPESISSKAQQITLRANRPLSLECVDKRYYFTQNRCITDTILNDQMITCSKRSLFNVFQNICNYSVYSRQYEINNGYITLKGGHRAGICGTAVIENSRIINIKDLTSINIRIAREIKGCSDRLLNSINPLSGTLICGAPCSGKTTLIRDLARKLSYKYTVSLIDERNELSATVNGIHQNDIGMCDVFDGYIKADAITQSIRSMSPDIIVCDEVSTQSDVKAIESGVNSGVSFIATLHADSIDSIRNRAFVKELIRTNAFSHIVFLGSKNNIGTISSVLSAKSLF